MFEIALAGRGSTVQTGLQFDSFKGGASASRAYCYHSAACSPISAFQPSATDRTVKTTPCGRRGRGPGMARLSPIRSFQVSLSAAEVGGRGDLGLQPCNGALTPNSVIDQSKSTFHPLRRRGRPREVAGPWLSALCVRKVPSGRRLVCIAINLASDQALQPPQIAVTDAEFLQADNGVVEIFGARTPVATGSG